MLLSGVVFVVSNSDCVCFVIFFVLFVNLLVNFFGCVFLFILF